MNLNMTADLTEEDIKKAIIDFVNRQSGMTAKEVQFVVSERRDALDRSSGGYTISAKVKLAPRTSDPFGR